MTGRPRILGELVVAPATAPSADPGSGTAPGAADVARLISRRAEAAEQQRPVAGVADVARLLERRQNHPVPNVEE